MGEHYQNALRYQEEGLWRDALAELKQGAEEKDGMCCWWLCLLHDINGLWGFTCPTKHDYDALVDTGKDTNPRCMMLSIRRNIASSRTREIYGPLILSSGDQYAISEYYKDQLLYGREPFIEAVDLKFGEAYRQAAESKDFVALYLYGDCYDPERYWALELSAQKGFAIAQFSLARKLLNTGHYDKALFWYRKAADQQYDTAQKMICAIFHDRKNYAALLYWLKRRKESVIPKFRVDACKMLEDLKEHFEKIESCRLTCFVLMGIRYYRVNSLSALPKDVVKLIAKALWLTRDDDAWGDAGAAKGGACDKRIKI